MVTNNINFKNYQKKTKNALIAKYLKKLLKKSFKKDNLLNTLTNSYNYSYKKNFVTKFKKFSEIRLIGMGGSILGTEAIYDFLKHKIKKNFTFIDNLGYNFKDNELNKKKLNLIVSKSGNTLETISNTSVIIKKGDKNIFITENNNNYLKILAQKIKSEVVEHKNFIGGRYSVLSEVGMLPAELMGLKEKNFKQLNKLMNNQTFLNNLVNNVGATLNYLKNGKYVSIILNYDERSESLFKWYQQLIAESLGKKSKGILPVISSMPKDNHSLMQLYLDGPKKNFYTFFYVKDKYSKKITNELVLPSHNYLKNKNIQNIVYSQKLATEKVFKLRNIPFRSFEVLNRTEKSMGELFCFFILETILLGKFLKVNPFDQPAVELIKKETKKILI